VWGTKGSFTTPHWDAGTLIRLVIIGDIHDMWDPVQDAWALEFLQPDAAIFVGTPPLSHARSREVVTS